MSSSKLHFVVLLIIVALLANNGQSTRKIFSIISLSFSYDNKNRSHYLRISYIDV